MSCQMFHHKDVSRLPIRTPRTEPPSTPKNPKCPRTTSVYSHCGSFNAATTTSQGTIGLTKLNDGVATPDPPSCFEFNHASVAFRTYRLAKVFAGVFYREKENKERLFVLSARLTTPLLASTFISRGRLVGFRRVIGKGAFLVEMLNFLLH